MINIFYKCIYNNIELKKQYIYIDQIKKDLLRYGRELKCIKLHNWTAQVFYKLDTSNKFYLVNNDYTYKVYYFWHTEDGHKNWIEYGSTLDNDEMIKDINNNKAFIIKYD
jgi:hypothetical protein